jgi:uncharacterized damage-inducible protein DinB
MNVASTRLAAFDPEAYRQRLFQLVGEQEPLRIMEQTSAALADIVRRHPATVLRARPFEGKWTPLEIIGHLADGEWVYGFRLRLIFCEDTPQITGTAQDAWVARQRHNDRDASELVEAFRVLRELNLAYWASISKEDLQRAGLHNERGEETLLMMMRLMAGHDLSHLGQIRQYIRATGA